MRALLIVVLLAAAGWSGYWLVGARSLERAVEAWLVDRRCEGWAADAASVDVRGFPNRFDLTLEALDLADPETGLAWSAPFFQVLALSYRPNHVIAVWPPDQTIATPDERVAVSADDLRGSLRLAPGTDLALEQATVVAEALRLESDAGWEAALENGRLAARRVEGTTYQIGVEVQDLAPAAEAVEQIDASAALPREVDLLRLDALVTFDSAWDRRAIEKERPQPVAIDLTEARVSWGELDLRLGGEVDVGPDGVPVGRITVRAQNWREMLTLAVAAGLIPEGLAPTLESGLGLLAGLSGAPGTLDAPLDLANGQISLGPVPLGPSPRLILR
ncbi:DUF2125 domain-containing protein [Roseitranquillus sediminis]|uniref:DUF2125 domain-containing protein n=1 Tax=Roseitranquillus sediminis TaxID=2809051 RepID=UPI001D0BF6ED|nr:DUF2125 domain-containing protein [Roseitranquillus sediminis]MBM9595895.1 DUF2125 domain-containing protein [Roseitranquillus sediminis]